MNKTRSRLCINVIVTAAIGMAGCSIIDTKKIDGVQRLGAWQSQAARTAKGAPQKCETSYNGAKDELHGWVSGTLAAEINDLASGYFGTIDLSEQRIPAGVTTKVSAFLHCPGGITTLDAGATALIFTEILNWAADTEKASRKDSADALKKELTNLEWKDWTIVHSQIIRK